MAGKTVWYGHYRARGLGEIWFAESQAGVWRTDIGVTRAQFLKRLAADKVEAVHDERRTAKIRRALADYTTGRRHSFALPIDWSRVRKFQKKALQVCARVPFGQTLSYGEIARRAGVPGGPRAAGQAMARNPFPIIVPCHRVIRSNGSLGGFSGNLRLKLALLGHEGVRLGI